MMEENKLSPPYHFISSWNVSFHEAIMPRYILTHPKSMLPPAALKYSNHSGTSDSVLLNPVFNFMWRKHCFPEKIMPWFIVFVTNFTQKTKAKTFHDKCQDLGHHLNKLKLFISEENKINVER